MQPRILPILRVLLVRGFCGMAGRAASAGLVLWGGGFGLVGVGPEPLGLGAVSGLPSGPTRDTLSGELTLLLPSDLLRPGERGIKTEKISSSAGTITVFACIELLCTQYGHKY